MRTSLQRGGLGLAGILLVLAALAALSARAGGPVTWHVTNGISMLPGITPGTLVVSHRQDSYDVGDVVAYRSTQLGQVVIHRVVELDGDRMVLQGDNNSWLDPERPLPSEAVGARVFQLQGVGGVLGWLSRPTALLGGAVVVAVALLQASPVARRRRGRTSGGTADPQQPRPPTGGTTAAMTSPKAPRLSPLPAGVDTAVRVGVGCCTLLALAATTGPFLKTTERGVDAHPVVTWSYGAEVDAGLTYPDGVVRTGDLLYTRLVPSADVTAELALDAPEGTTASGTWRLEVSVENGDGWTRTTSTGAPASTELPRLQARLPVAALLRLADDVSAETGVAAAGVRFTVTAVLDLTLDDGGERTTEQVTSVLAFTADAQRVALDPGTPLVQDLPLPLASEGEQQVLELVGLSLPPGPTRLVAGAGVALGVLVLALARGARRSEDEDDEIARTAGALLVAVDPGVKADEVVDVSSFAALLGIATRYERMVLFTDDEGLRFYFVLDDGVAYRWFSPRAAARLDAERATTRVDDDAAPGPATALPRPRSPERDGADR